MDIYRMEREAQDRMSNNEPMNFVIIGLFGTKKAQWLDPYFGFLQIEGSDGFNTTAQIANAPVSVVWAEEWEEEVE